MKKMKDDKTQWLIKNEIICLLDFPWICIIMHITKPVFAPEFSWTIFFSHTVIVSIYNCNEMERASLSLQLIYIQKLPAILTFAYDCSAFIFSNSNMVEETDIDFLCSYEATIMFIPNYTKILV